MTRSSGSRASKRKSRASSEGESFVPLKSLARPDMDPTQAIATIRRNLLRDHAQDRRARRRARSRTPQNLAVGGCAKPRRRLYGRARPAPARVGTSKQAQGYFAKTTFRRAVVRTTSATLRSVDSIFKSFSVNRGRSLMDSATGVLGFLISATAIL